MGRKNYSYKRTYEERYKKKLYRLNRSKYRWFSNYVKLRIFRKFIRNLKNREMLLDVGGGTANWSYLFLKDFNKIAVLEISKQALKQIPEKEIIKKHGSVMKMPIKSESIDCILLIDVFEHIAEKDIVKMVKELDRVLKKDGKIIIFTSEYGLGISFIFHRILGDMEGRLTKREIRAGHLNRLKFAEIKKLLEENNLKIEDYYHYGQFFQPITEFLKDSFAKIMDKIRGKKDIIDGQDFKDKINETKEIPIIARIILYLFSFVSCLDILFFGKIIPGDSIFLSVVKK